MKIPPKAARKEEKKGKCPSCSGGLSSSGGTFKEESHYKFPMEKNSMEEEVEKEILSKVS